MFSQLTRYISRQLLFALLLIAFSLTAIIWLTQALRFIDYIVNRGVSTLTFLQLTGLMVPSLLFVILPVAVFISIIFIYQRLNSDSELVVLGAAGQSRWQLSRPVWLIGGGAMLISYFLSLYLLPLSYHKFKDMQSFLRDNYASLLLQEEVFNTPIKGLTVFVRKRHKDGTLEGLLVHDNRDEEIPITMMAQRGRIEQADSGPRFLLYHGNRQQRREGRFSFLKFDEYVMDLSFYAAEVTDRKRKPEEFFLPELFAEAKRKPERAAELKSEAWHRLTWPLYSLILGLFAFALLMRGEFNRRGMAKRLTLMVAMEIVIISLALAMQNIITNHPALTPLMPLNALFWLGAAMLLLQDTKPRQIPIIAPKEMLS
jgi:lipopolysaccharide export system permease protein